MDILFKVNLAYRMEHNSQELKGGGENLIRPFLLGRSVASGTSGEYTVRP